jgi:hypothetical protein
MLPGFEPALVTRSTPAGLDLWLVAGSRPLASARLAR